MLEYQRGRKQKTNMREEWDNLGKDVWLPLEKYGKVCSDLRIQPCSLCSDLKIQPCSLCSDLRIQSCSLTRRVVLRRHAYVTHYGPMAGFPYHYPTTSHREDTIYPPSADALGRSVDWNLVTVPNVESN
jgi:hypothetical protein